MKTKASTSKRSSGAKRHHPKSRPVRKSSRKGGAASNRKARAALIPTIVGATPGGIPSALPADKRDDELTDEESLDREERQDLY